MFKRIGSFIAGMLGTDQAAKLAVDLIADKAGLNDMNAKEKAQFMLDFMAATKHQSPVRRFLAILVSVMWAALIFSWMVLCFVGNVFDVSGAITTAGLFFTMLKEVSPYLAGVMAFYFSIGAINSLKSK